MELETLRKDYIELVKTKDASLAKHENFLDSFLELKDYNTCLRIAITNISNPKNDGAIRKAKQLALKGGLLVTSNSNTIPNEKKRKAEGEPAIDEPRVKRPYKKRVSLKPTTTATEMKKIEGDAILDAPTYNSLRETCLKAKMPSQNTGDSSSDSEEHSGFDLFGQKEAVELPAFTVSDTFQ